MLGGRLHTVPNISTLFLQCPYLYKETDKDRFQKNDISVMIIIKLLSLLQKRFLLESFLYSRGRTAFPFTVPDWLKEVLQYVLAPYD
jgi:hypothetical protein